MNDIELYDIYDIWYEPPWFIRYNMALLVVAISLLFFWIGYYIYRKKLLRKKNCWEITLEKINKLNKYISVDNKLIYFNLTAIIKEYLMERYYLDVKSKTDSEVIENIETYNLPEEISEDLKKILSGATMIKFANRKVDDSIVRDDLNVTIRMVNKTIPKEG